MMTQGAERTAETASEAIQSYYDNPTDANRKGDEFIAATTIVRPNGPTLVKDGDAIIFLNYRGDRTREITKAFVYPDDQWKDIEGGGFDRGRSNPESVLCHHDWL